MNNDPVRPSFFETLKEIAPGFAGGPASIWQAARKGTESAAAALPNAVGLDQVKGFVERHPVVSTCLVLAAGYYMTGGRLPLAASLLGKVV